MIRVKRFQIGQPQFLNVIVDGLCRAVLRSRLWVSWRATKRCVGSPQHVRWLPDDICQMSPSFFKVSINKWEFELSDAMTTAVFEHSMSLSRRDSKSMTRLRS